MIQEQTLQNETITIEKNKQHRSKLIPLAVFLGIWAIAIIYFWLFLDGADAMGWSILYLYLLLPITTFIASLLIGKNKEWDTSKWFLPIFFGVMYMLSTYLTFGMANTLSFGRVHKPEYGMLLWGAAISLIGLAIGSLIQSVRKK